MNPVFTDFFLARLLRFSPRARLSCSRALRHPFFVRFCSTECVREGIQLAKLHAMSKKKTEKMKKDKERNKGREGKGRARATSPQAKGGSVERERSLSPFRAAESSFDEVPVVRRRLFIEFAFIFTSNLFSGSLVSASGAPIVSRDDDEYQSALAFSVGRKRKDAKRLQNFIIRSKAIHAKIAKEIEEEEEEYDKETVSDSDLMDI